MPTENGSPLLAGRQPQRDATLVSLLRRAGAVVLGKTVTTEFALYAPNQTRNPHDPAHTPGGSSSGSAAAVAAQMVPLAIGSQTNGSVIRPASFCGVYGYKPSHGLISRRGVLELSRRLDHIGVFARTLDDLALLAAPLMGYDDGDPDMRPAPPPALRQGVAEPVPVAPRIGFAKTPMWDAAEPATQAAFAELVDALGDAVAEVTLEAPFERAVEWHRLVMESDVARNHGALYDRAAAGMSPQLRGIIERGRGHLAVDYNRVQDWVAALNRMLEAMFEWHDALLTPASTGPAPRGLEATGDPVFCTLWSFLGVPAVSLPLFVADNGLPFAAQLVGPRGADARLLRTARWLVEQVGAA
jgi:Asp-tRNA(Asn)/Glu-tRNA(Gln) amidotransferase A subunit family amidase